MARKYPKYVKETGKTLGYQRAVPTRLQHIAKKRLYTYPLGLSLSASDEKIHRALADADEAFRLFCKTVEFSSPSSYSENEIDRLAQVLVSSFHKVTKSKFVGFTPKMSWSENC
jgi:hypothetical protein